MSPRVFIAGLLLCVTGCASRTDSLRTRFANDTGCPERSVLVVAQSNSRFNASGCDRAITYTCDNLLGSGADGCSSELPRSPGGPPPSRPSTPIDNPQLQREQ